MNDSFLGGGKADRVSIAEGSPDAVAVLQLANSADAATLRNQVHLSRLVTDEIVAERPFSTLAQLDAVPWVGPKTFQKLLDYARAHAAAWADGFVDGQQFETVSDTCEATDCNQYHCLTATTLFRKTYWLHKMADGGWQVDAMGEASGSISGTYGIMSKPARVAADGTFTLGEGDEYARELSMGRFHDGILTVTYSQNVTNSVSELDTSSYSCTIESE